MTTQADAIFAQALNLSEGERAALAEQLLSSLNSEAAFHNPLAGKLRVMEALWDDLCHHQESLPSPDWHGEILHMRAQRLETGEAAFSDWQEAKNRIRERCHADSNPG